MTKQINKARVIGAVIGVAFGFLFAHFMASLNTLIDGEMERATKEQCWEYAKANHEGEFSELRWKTIVEPMNVSAEQWYTWCIDNIKNTRPR